MSRHFGVNRMPYPISTLRVGHPRTSAVTAVALATPRITESAKTRDGYAGKTSTCPAFSGSRRAGQRARSPVVDNSGESLLARRDVSISPAIPVVPPPLSPSTGRT
jgi:hypothetical protein